MGRGQAIVTCPTYSAPWRAAAGSRPGCADGHCVRNAQWPAKGTAPSRIRLRFRDDVLATLTRVAGSRCVATPASSAARPLERGRATRLVPRQPGRARCADAKKGSHTGRNPTDRGKPGMKRHLLVDRRGTPLAVCLIAANCHDSPVLRRCSMRSCPCGRSEVAPANGHRNYTPTKATTTASAGWRYARAALKVALPDWALSPASAWVGSAGW